jgi:uncharacterized RDD family membrane protein YckC
MTAAPAATAGSAGASGPTPSLPRLMACFVYEGLLLFGLALVPGALGALFFAQTGQQHPLQSPTALRLFALVLFGVYFVWLWSARGQTLAMQTWRIRLQADGSRPPSQRRALARYVACCCCWFGPPALLASVEALRPWPALAGFAIWTATYALSALAAPKRQFWHDLLCGTRLVDVRASDDQASLRPRPR